MMHRFAFETAKDMARGQSRQDQGEMLAMCKGCAATSRQKTSHSHGSGGNGAVLQVYGSATSPVCGDGGPRRCVPTFLFVQIGLMDVSFLMPPTPRRWRAAGICDRLIR